MVSVKDLADKLHVSRQTIRNEMKRQGISPIDGKDSYGRICFYVDEDAIEKISDEIRKRQEIRKEEMPSEIEQLQKEKAALESSHEYLANRYAETMDKVKELETEIKDLRKELAAKDELLSFQREQLQKAEEHSSDLLRSLDNMTESVKASQILMAGYQQRIEQHTDKKWWQFWKKSEPES